MKRTLVLIALIVLLCVLLSACGKPKPLDFYEILESLPEEVGLYTIINPYAVYEPLFGVDERGPIASSLNMVTIDRRQTNEKEDIVYCTVSMSNRYYAIDRKIVCYYTYYDEGGWILDGWEDCEGTVCTVIENPLSQSQIRDAYLTDDTTIREVTVNEDNLHEIVYTFDILTEQQNWKREGNLIITASFDGTQWTTDADSSQVQEKWDIVGTWLYEEKRKGIFKGEEYTLRMKLEIDSYDPETGGLVGEWSAKYKQYDFSYPLTYIDYLEINVGEKCIEISNHPEWDFAFRDFIRIYPDRVEGTYRQNFSCTLTKQ